jgi:hypothetical protein
MFNNCLKELTNQKSPLPLRDSGCKFAPGLRLGDISHPIKLYHAYRMFPFPDQPLCNQDRVRLAILFFASFAITAQRCMEIGIFVNVGSSRF